MPLVKAGPSAVLGPGEMMEVNVGGVPYAICNVAGTLHALQGVCPHRGGPLGHGALHGTTVVCPWHAWEFDCVTGANDMDPQFNVLTVPVSVINSDIFLDLP